MQISIKSFLEVQHKKQTHFLSGKSGEELKIFILGGALGVFGLNLEVVADFGVKKNQYLHFKVLEEFSQWWGDWSLKLGDFSKQMEFEEFYFFWSKGGGSKHIDWKAVSR